jgi:hypothetical protein
VIYDDDDDDDDDDDYIYIHMYHRSNMAMENPRFIDGIPIKTSIYRGFSIARFEHEPCRMTVEQRNYFSLFCLTGGCIYIYI